MKDIAIVRSMSTKEGDHGRATFNLRTGYQPQGPIQYPTLGSLVAKELERRVGRAARLRQHLARTGRSTRPPSAPGSSARSTPR